MSQWSDLLVALAVWPGLFLLAGGALKLRADDGEETLMTRVLRGWVPPRAVALAELAVGALLLLGVPFSAYLAALLLAVAAGVATWGVYNVKEVSCGCFGARSEPVSPRTALRAGLLALFALGGAPWWPGASGEGGMAGGVAGIGGTPWWDASLAGFALALVAGAVLVALTPELRSHEARLTVNEVVCSHRPASLRTTLARLRRSKLWADARGYLAADAPSEQWRDGCWRYLAYPATYEGEDATAVFALYLGRSRSADGVAFVAAGEERVLGQIKGRK